jgi:hypothetical protein
MVHFLPVRLLNQPLTNLNMQLNIALLAMTVQGSPVPVDKPEPAKVEARDCPGNATWKSCHDGWINRCPGICSMIPIRQRGDCTGGCIADATIECQQFCA